MRGAVLAAVVLLATVAGPVAGAASGVEAGVAEPTAPEDIAGASAPTGAAPATTRATVGVAAQPATFAAERAGAAEQPGATEPAGASERAGGWADATAGAAEDTLAVADRQPPVAVDHELNLTPAEPGTLRVTIRPQVPEEAGNVSVALSKRATVVNATGFAREGDRFRLREGAEAPSLTYRLSVNRTAAGGELTAVDAGPWALVRTPEPTVEAEGATVHRRYRVDGPGVVGPSLTFLGAHRTYERTVEDEHIELVVPAAAEMRSPPAAVVESLASAARSTAVGEGDQSVLFVVAPTSVDWAYAAQQVGDDDAWVRADQSLYSPRNAWLHEYVHTRQAFRTTERTRWLVEGTATYYAALMSLRQGLIDFEQFRRYLLAGTAERNERAVLADPGTWRGTRVQYRKGALVVGALDRRIRSASDGWRSFQWVFRRLNAHDGLVRQGTLGSLLEAAGGSRVRVAGHRFATEPTAPSPWRPGDHAAAFGWSPPQVSADLASLSAAGPGGRRQLTDDGGTVVITTAERLVATVLGANGGGRPATMTAAMRVNFTAVNRTTVRVRSGETARTRVAYRFDRPGTYYVTVAGEAVRVRVVEPARSVEVTDVSVTPSDGQRGRVTVVTRVRNPLDRPAQVSLPVTVDGEVVATRTVSVGPHQARRVSTTLRLNESGQYRVVVAGEGTRVTVGESGHVVTASTGTPTTAAPLSPTPAGSTGVGLVAALTLLVLAGSALRWRG